jgi:hypothetical protein
MNNLPPSLATEKKPFASTAGTIGLALWLAGIGVGLLFYFFKTSADESGTPLAPAIVIAFRITAFACHLAGVLCGAVALSGLQRHGRVGLFGKSLFLGALLLSSGILVALLSPPASDPDRTREQMDQAINDALKIARDAIHSNSTNGTPGNSAALEKTISATRKMAEKRTGAEALSMQASLAYMAKLQATTKLYDQALGVLIAAEILNGATLTSREGLAPRRKAVEDFLAANASLHKFIGDSERLFEEELIAHNLSPDSRAKAMAGFHSKNRNALVMKVRDTDQRIGSAFLAELDLLEKQWGRWTFDKATDQFQFQEAAAAQRHAALQKEIDEASQEQAALQQQILSGK